MRFYFQIVFLLIKYVYDKRTIAEDFDYLRRVFFRPLNDLRSTCQSKIYCNSDFLHDVQLSRINISGDTLLHKKLRYTESEILAKYDQMKKINSNKVLSYDDLSKFIDENFEEGNELENWTPSDFTENIPMISRIKDPDYKRWARELNNVWKTLARKIKNDVKIQPDKYSIIWVPNGFIIPGGIFKELYYWDTYWIVNGLLLCDMKTTARGIIENIISLVNEFGFMPNGGRVYYLNRSQPPMLILMTLSYYEATDDFDFIKTVIGSLEIEYQFWLENRMVTFKKDGKMYNMARYNARSEGPRPESYWNDYKLAEHYQTEEEKNDVYINVKSAAESGWDFSSRWFITVDGSNCGNLSDIQTTNIIPVDLNSLLHVNALTLSTWFNQMGNINKANKYSAIAQNFLNSIQEVMWRPDKGAWLDWDLKNQKHREYFYASNIVPLWTGSYTMPKTEVANAVLKYLKDQRIIESDHGIHFNGTPTSLYNTTQQWDFPNAWPPLQAFIIQGLHRTGDKNAQKIAANLADVWLRTNYKGFADKSMMFEKYNVLIAGETGGGGEYTPQTGFGWTNGVVFEFLNQWGELATFDSNNNS